MKNTQNSATKIIATIGPSTSSYDEIVRIIKAGATVLRLNFSHGTHEEHLQTVRLIKKARQELQQFVALALDTKGPEFRTICPTPLGIKKNDMVVFMASTYYDNSTPLACAPNTHLLSSNVKNWTKVGRGETILVDDGKLKLRVISNNEGDRDPDQAYSQGEGCSSAYPYCKEGLVAIAVNSHRLLNNKRIYFKNSLDTLDFLQPSDVRDIQFANENGFDCIFLSFVETSANIHSVRKIVDDPSIQIIAKIETQRGVDNIADIVDAADGIMIARGDLCTNVGVENMLPCQKKLVKFCHAKPIIMATELMLSMTDNSSPTRAEISDVGNAVCDGCSAVMLSSETAVGLFPSICVDTVRNICLKTEEYLRNNGMLKLPNYEQDLQNVQREATNTGCAIVCDDPKICRPFIFMKGVHLLLK